MRYILILVRKSCSIITFHEKLTLQLIRLPSTEEVIYIISKNKNIRLNFESWILSYEFEIKIMTPLIEKLDLGLENYLRTCKI